MNIVSIKTRRVCALLVAGLWLCPVPHVFAVCAAGNENSAVPATAPSGHFSDNGNGTVTDRTTGLMWKRCGEGQVWNGTTCTGALESYVWVQALTHADTTTFAGFSDWRVPNKNELRSIVEQRCYSPSISVDIFPGEPDDFFWSSSPYDGYSVYAWNVNFTNGHVDGGNKSLRGRVRLVRAGR